MYCVLLPRGRSRLQIRLQQSSVIKAPISFLNIHKLLWKSKILVHGHVRIFLNFVTFPLIVLIKIVQVIKNIFFGTGFVTLHGKPYFLFPDVLKRWSFQKNCAGIWSFLYYRERWFFFFPKIWSYTLDGK